MPCFTSLCQPVVFVATLFPLLALSHVGVHGRDSQVGTTPFAAPVAKTTAVAPAEPPLSGTGKQMRVLAVVCDMWEAQRLAAAKKGSRKVDLEAPQDSLDIRDYDFSVAQEKDVFKVTLRPRNPAVLKSVSPQGTQLMNNSSTFFYDVRRSDFRVVSVSAIL